MSHTLLALSPRDFWDVAGGLDTARLRSVSTSWSTNLLTTDGFFAYRRPQATCTNPREFAATPELRSFIDARLAPTEPIALAGRGVDSTGYWADTNRITLALERPVTKPGPTRFVLRWLEKPDPRALTTIGPWELFDLTDQARGQKPRHRKRRPKPAPGAGRRARAPRVGLGKPQGRRCGV